MTRLLPVAGLVVASVGLTGCAATVDTLTSRKFREKPFETLFKPGDPLTVMRTSEEGDERAAAMRRLKEPLLNGRSQEEQDEAIRLLSEAATADPSPVVRVAAVDALGRFHDPRAVQILTAAYHQASGVSEPRAKSVDRFLLSGPSGFAPEMVTVIRTRTVESLAATGRPEAVPVLTQAAAGHAGDAEEADRDVRLAAVRGLAKLRVPESVVALSNVLSAEKGKDPALAGRAHEGLVRLTGQSLPADPERWQAVVQAGVVIAPEPDPVQRAINWVINP